MITKLVLKAAAMLAMSSLTGATANSRDLNVMAPILGNYLKTSVLLSGDKTVMPNSAPTNTTSINVLHFDRVQRKAGRLSRNGHFTDYRRASGRDGPCDGEGVRQRCGQRDQDIHAASEDAGDVVNPVSFRSCHECCRWQRYLCIWSVGDFNGDGKAGRCGDGHCGK